MPRARFTVDEVVALTLDFYKRNYIEGLFLSSGIIRSPDYTMEQLVRVARDAARRRTASAATSTSRRSPRPTPALIEQAGLYADRLSINVELPTDAGLDRARAGEAAARPSARAMARAAADDRGAPRPNAAEARRRAVRAGRAVARR